MNRSLVKNFILLLLVLVNLFLLVIVFSEAREERSLARYRLEALEAVLLDNGISLSPGFVLPEEVPPQVFLRRDLEAEKRLITSLIGQSQREDGGGNIYFYQGKNGEAQFRGTGEFEIILDTASLSGRRDRMALARSALKKLGIEAAEPTESGETLSFPIYYDGTPIKNAQVTFDFISDEQLIISGTRPLDVRDSVRSSERFPDEYAVLMSFLEAVHEKGYIFSEISGLELEYNMYFAVSGSCTLRPRWRILTNSGPYFFDAETGKPESSESFQSAA